ncbi:hypothetical protein TSUD_306810 [Trifolium subterraneum]|uniref:Reverse transcriptase zinc-binding domain-containing protein n=1 Tax=Trifolium subterraneum TaxID=3900 RepID=A0A2Z6P118_TRISU|nr:hypothetical protein TSUD_306810 [Trifolium subterraneum]
MSSRRRVSTISQIMVNDTVIEGVQGIREAVFMHFENHFRSVRVARPSIANLQFSSISEADAYSLERPFREQEVKQAIWECDSFKSPGPDGINFGFIKEFWADVKGDFMRFLLEFYSNGRLVKGTNCTFIVLIPKVTNPQQIADYCPISLVGYRQILDGILIANEVVDDAKKRKKEMLMFKVDFEKAYDSVEWGYLDSVMMKMGFSTKWRQWIMTCVSTATVSVLVNGSPTNEFNMQPSVLHCKLGHIPFMYLGLPIGGNAKRQSFWSSLVDKIRCKLSLWKSRHLSMGGRLVLLKSVLSSIPVYFLSFFKAPTGTISLLESIFKAFLWGGSEESRKINWIKWDKICLDKEHEGLGVRRVKEFNISLLGKWCWRLLQEPESLWVQVLAAKYGMKDGQVDLGGIRASNWWNNINSIRFGTEGGAGSWFVDNVVKRLGDGEKTLFWKDKWVDGISLKSQFGRLFDLSLDREVTVADMCRRGWEVGGNGWRWRRRLFAWEEQLWGDCYTIVANVVLQVASPDVWEWIPDYSTGYSVGGAYHLLTRMYARETSSLNDIVWNKLVPSTVSTFAWRFVNDRLPTKFNLFTRGCLHNDSLFCSAGCDAIEDIHHLFLNCPVFGAVWRAIILWLGITCVLPDNAVSLASQFCGAHDFSKSIKTCLQAIWLSTVWSIWKARNNRVFSGTIVTIDRLLFAIKVQVWWWFKARKKGFCFDLNHWMLNPKVCIGLNTG